MIGVSEFVKRFFNSCRSALSGRGLVLAVLNTLFFGSVLAGVLLSQLWFPPPYERVAGFPEAFSIEGDLLVVLLSKQQVN